MPKRSIKTRPIFVFLGLTESGTDPNISVLQERLENIAAIRNQPIKIEPKDDLLILTLSNPGFCFYVALIKNYTGQLPYWTDLAKNFKLSWDSKPVTATRLKCIFEEGYQFEYNVYHEIGFAILNELEKFTQREVFTIPSFERRGLWRKIFNV